MARGAFDRIVSNCSFSIQFIVAESTTVEGVNERCECRQAPQSAASRRERILSRAARALAEATLHAAAGMPRDEIRFFAKKVTAEIDAAVGRAAPDDFRATPERIARAEEAGADLAASWAKFFENRVACVADAKDADTLAKMLFAHVITRGRAALREARVHPAVDFSLSGDASRVDRGKESDTDRTAAAAAAAGGAPPPDAGCTATNTDAAIVVEARPGDDRAKAVVITVECKTSMLDRYDRLALDKIMHGHSRAAAASAAAADDPGKKSEKNAGAGAGQCDGATDRDAWDDGRGSYHVPCGGSKTFGSCDSYFLVFWKASVGPRAQFGSVAEFLSAIRLVAFVDRAEFVAAGKDAAKTIRFNPKKLTETGTTSSHNDTISSLRVVIGGWHAAKTADARGRDYASPAVVDADGAAVCRWAVEKYAKMRKDALASQVS